MKKSLRSLISSRRNTFLLLSALLVIAGISIAAWQTSAQRRSKEQSKTVDIGTEKAETAAPKNAPLAVSAMLQIQALQDEKESRTPAQKKMDSQLVYAVKMARNEPIAQGMEKLEVNVGADEKGYVTVDISADIDNELLKALKEMGVEYSNVFPQYHSLRAETKLSQLESIAEMSKVRFIQPKQLATTNQATQVDARELPAANPLVFPGRATQAENVRRVLAENGIGNQTNALPNGYNGVGSVNAEAVISHGVYSARGAFNTTGSGIRIGVLSNGVTTMATSQGTGDIPPTCSSLTPAATEQCVNVVPGQAGTGDEGTAMLEVVHDIAPGAQLYFATGNTGITQFAANILALRNVYNCDIIVDDIGYFAEAPFQDGQGPLVISNTNGGVVTQAVNDVVASGALYFSSAANSGNLNDATSGTWEGDFVSAGTLALVPGGNVLDFDTSAAVATSDLLTVGSGTAPVSLSWSDKLGASSNDYDLYILNSTLTTVITAATNLQTGTQDPIEQTSVTVAANRRAVILQKTGAADRFLHFDTNRGVLSIGTSGNTHGHNAASGGIGVAATPVFMPFAFPAAGIFFNGPYPNAYTAADKTETFSSDGPRRSFYSGDGTAFTPGNFSSTGGSLFQQPVMAASDGNSVTGVGGFGSPFYGTSCAAPAAAAMAGLIKSANPALTGPQIKTAMTNTAIDVEAPGVDRDTGSGVVRPYSAMQSLALPGKAFVEFNGVTVTESCGNGDGLIEPGETANLVVNLKNTGLTSATGVTTTLTTGSGPNIQVLQSTSGYSNLAASGGAGGNTTQFKFGLSQATPVDQVANFTLTINYAGGWAASQVINFTVQTGRQPIATTLDATAPATSVSFPVTATTAQTGRLNLSGTGTQSVCGTAKTNPGASATGSRNSDTFTLTNPTAASVCVTATLIEDKLENDFLFHVAYAGSFVPAAPSTNYLADWGTSNRILPMTFSFNVAGGQTVVLAVPGNTAGLSGTPYTLQVSGLPLTAAPFAGCATAAGVNVGGRVLTSDGRGVRNAVVRLIDQNGVSRQVVTGPLGSYLFDDVEAGQTYTVEVNSRRYSYSPRLVSLTDNVTGLDFIPE